MKYYEYKTYIPKMKGFYKMKPSEDIEEELNGFGKDGWELVSVVPMNDATGKTFGGTTSVLVYYLRKELLK